MVVVLSGFPSRVAALQFEWACALPYPCPCAACMQTVNMLGCTRFRATSREESRGPTSGCAVCEAQWMESEAEHLGSNGWCRPACCEVVMRSTKAFPQLQLDPWRRYPLTLWFTGAHYEQARLPALLHACSPLRSQEAACRAGVGTAPCGTGSHGCAVRSSLQRAARPHACLQYSCGARWRSGQRTFALRRMMMTIVAAHLILAVGTAVAVTGAHRALLLAEARVLPPARECRHAPYVVAHRTARFAAATAAPSAAPAAGSPCRSLSPAVQTGEGRVAAQLARYRATCCASPRALQREAPCVCSPTMVWLRCSCPAPLTHAQESARVVLRRCGGRTLCGAVWAQ